MPRNIGEASVPNVKCPVCQKDVRGALPSAGGKVIEAWHREHDPYPGKGLKR